MNDTFSKALDDYIQMKVDEAIKKHKEQSEPNIKPCPFCGYKDSWIFVLPQGSFARRVCLQCDCSTRDVRIEKRATNSITALDAAKVDALWNMRGGE